MRKSRCSAGIGFKILAKIEYFKRKHRLKISPKHITLINTLPSCCRIILIPAYEFIRLLSSNLLLFKAAEVFGFLGMFRDSSFAKFSTGSMVLVTAHGRQLTLSSGSSHELFAHARKFQICGFYFRFSAKFHAHARA